MLNCAEQDKNTKQVHIRHPKHVSRQSCSNIQLSSKDGYKKNVPINANIVSKFT